jgi:hypothetical protein
MNKTAPWNALAKSLEELNASLAARTEIRNEQTKQQFRLYQLLSKRTELLSQQSELIRRQNDGLVKRWDRLIASMSESEQDADHEDLPVPYLDQYRKQKQEVFEVLTLGLAVAKRGLQEMRTTAIKANLQ